MPLLATLADDFNDNIIDAVKWSGNFGTVVETGGRARVTCNTNYNAYQSGAIYTLAGSSSAVRVFPPAVGGGTNVFAQMLVITTTSGTDAGFSINPDLGTLQMFVRVGFSDAGQINLTYDATNHAWVRLREFKGNLYWDTSAEGVLWINRRAAISPPWVSNINLAVQLIAHRDSGTNDFAEFDNYNGPTTVIGSQKLGNVNWPTGGFDLDAATGPPNFPTIARRSIEATYRRLAVRQFSVVRGRQYELDQVQAGEFTALLHDPLEMLNVDNTASPFNTGGNTITPYRSMWNWWIWPNQPGSGNIINVGVNVAYDPSFENNPFTELGLWTAAGGTTTLAQSGAQHFDGTKALLVTQSAAGAGFGANNNFRTSPDITYTFSAYVYPTGGCSVTIQVTDANNVVHSSATTAVQNAWTRLSVTWDAVDTLEAVVVYGTGVATPTFYVDATQLEFGAQVTAFSTTGPTLYTLWTGWVERFPTSYDMSGLRALHELYGVDALAILSRTAIAQSYTATVVADNPAIYEPLSPSKPATSGTALSIGSDATQVVGSPITGNPIYHPSASGSINWAGDQQLDGTPAVVLQQNNAYNPPKSGNSTFTYPHEQQTVFDVYPAGVTIANSAATIEMWVKFSGGVALLMQLLATAVHGGGLNTELGYGASASQNHLELSTSGGRLAFAVTDAVEAFSAFYQVSAAPGAGYPDGQWHYYAFFFYASGGNPALGFRYDGGEFSVTAPTTKRNYGYTNLHHEATTVFGDPQSQVSIARFAIYPRDIGSTARQAHYQRGIGYLGEISGARVSRLLSQYWAGSTSIDPGFLAMAADFEYNGRVMLDVLQEIQESERGLVYAATGGAVTFEGRTTRYGGTQAALWVFGENPAGASPAEYPYEDYATDLDPTYTFSQSNLTRPGNSNFAPVVNTPTQTKYGQRVLSQQVQCTTDFDLTQAAIFYNNRYATAAVRLAKLVLNPAANPALWPVVLSLEISQRVTVKRRNAGLTVSRDYYIEKITHAVDAEAGKWMVTLQLSPVFVSSAWVMGNSTFGVLGTNTTPVY